MAQGRIISPEFWTDVKMTRLSHAARLFYIGTWNFAYCDKGHLPDDPDELKLRILPADAVDASDLLAELMGAGRIVREQDAGGSWLTISNFAKHQRRDDPRWTRKCPICKPRESTQEHSGGMRGEDRSGVEVEGSTPGGRPSRYCSKHPNGTDGGCYACRDARLAQERWDRESRVPPANTPPQYVHPSKCSHPEGWVKDGYCHRCDSRVR